MSMTVLQSSRQRTLELPTRSPPSCQVTACYQYKYRLIPVAIQCPERAMAKMALGMFLWTMCHAFRGKSHNNSVHCAHRNRCCQHGAVSCTPSVSAYNFMGRGFNPVGVVDTSGFARKESRNGSRRKLGGRWPWGRVSSAGESVEAAVGRSCGAAHDIDSLCSRRPSNVAN